MRDEEDSIDTWFEDIVNWVFEFKHKIYNWLREAERQTERDTERHRERQRDRIYNWLREAERQRDRER